MKLSDLPPAPKFAPKNRQAVLPMKDLFAPRGMPVEDSAELTRIVELPRRPQVGTKSLTAQAIVERETAKYRLDRTEMGPCRCKEINPDGGCITRLLPIQAITLREMSMVGGVIGAISAGGGKTFIGLLAILALGFKRVARQQGLLLVPASLIKQICHDYELLAEHFRVPEIVVHMQPRDRTWSVPNMPVLHVMTHDAISQPKNSAFIENLLPSALIIDEIDAFASLESSRGLRLGRFFDEHGEHTAFCGWSGSLTDKSLTDFAHLCAYAFRLGSPLPLDQVIVEDIARCLDAVESPCPPGALMRLVEDCDVGNSELMRVRAAFHRRLAETPGFILSESAEVFVTNQDGKITDQLVELIITSRTVPPIPEIVQRALDKVRDMKRPDTLAGALFDDPIEDALRQAKFAREVSCGMFYYADFPHGEAYEDIKAWYSAKSDWYSERREMMLRGQRHLDSPKLCEDAAKRGWGDIPEGVLEESVDGEGQISYKDNRHLPIWKANNWPRWRDLQNTVRPVQKAYRLDPFLVQDAAKWGLSRRGIIWYAMVELGQWIGELSGLPVHEGGPDAGDELLAEIRNNKRSIIASIKSHGRGRDKMQYQFDEQYVINTLSSNKLWEQLLARTHRLGQRSQTVRTEVCVHTPELAKSFKQALRRSDYVESVLDQTMRLRLAQLHVDV